jgi:hypothetical protein
MIRLRACALLALSILAGSCINPTGPRHELETARARWKRLGIESYDLTVQLTCECPSSAPFISQVRDGQIVAQMDATTGQPIGPPFRSTGTVDGLFDLLAESANANPDQMDVEYDFATGYPKRGSVDRSFQIADDEYWFTAVLRGK